MRTHKIAMSLTLAFLGCSTFYILASDWLVMRWTTEPEQLQMVQSLKGTIYVIIVSSGFFLLALTLLKRVDVQVEHRKREQEALLDAERRTITGTLAASMAHDINNLVGVIMPNLEFVLEHKERIDADQLGPLQDAFDATEQLSQITLRLRRAAARQCVEERLEMSIEALLQETVEMLASHSKLKHHALETRLDHSIRLSLYPELLRHALINLLINAAEATGERGRIRVSLQLEEDAVAILVEDDGPGVSESVREKIARPFFSTKEDGNGLGLFSVTYCAERHGGSFAIERSELGGAQMILRLPRDADRPLIEHDSDHLSHHLLLAHIE